MNSFHFTVLTPSGRGAIATLLVEGAGAEEAVERCVELRSNERVGEWPIGRIWLRTWTGESRAAGEEVVLCRTGPGRVEVSCHGGRAAVARIAGDLAACGGVERDWRTQARSEEGDLSRGEARIALAEALSERAGLILLDQYGGALAWWGKGLVEELAGRSGLEARSTSLGEIDELLATADLGQHLTRPWRVVLAGRPNAGKSSLMNALVGYERSIVYREPGTTRDILSALTAFEGWPVELLDTAGLRGADDPIEQAGVALAEREVAAADLVLWITPADEPSDDPPPTSRTMLRVMSKCDLVEQTLGQRAGEPPGLRTSAKTGFGIQALGAAIAKELVPRAPQPGEAILFTERQIQAIKNLRDQVDRGDWDLASKELTALSLGSAPI